MGSHKKMSPLSTMVEYPPCINSSLGYKGQRLLLCGVLTLPGTRGTWRHGNCYVHVFVQPCFHGSPMHT